MRPTAPALLRAALLQALLAALFAHASTEIANATPPRLELFPARVLEGDPVSIRVTGLQPGDMSNAV
ncbi:MAG TPA: hypothetical protein VN901_00545 [Candidatus Acidoferrales bacterium]|nr:hypothetical protein [Candidatus Acidoferrales bacterium]